MRCLGVKGGSGENFAQSERGCDPGLANVDNGDLGWLDFLTLGSTSQEGGAWVNILTHSHIGWISSKIPETTV